MGRVSNLRSTHFFAIIWHLVYLNMKNKDENKFKFQYLIGIDEVGKGPLAGPAATGGLFDFSFRN